MNDRILNKLAEAKESVKLVRENLPHTFEEFLSMNKLERDGIYKNIEFAIQNILDICALIVKDEDLQVPGSDDDIIGELQDAAIMNDDVMKVIREMKGHRYGALDDKIAYEDIRTGLNDFTTVFEEIEGVIF